MSQESQALADAEAMTLYIDYSKCIGCETCEAVCRFIHDAPRVHMTKTRDGQMFPLYCRHCEEAYCRKGCNKGAVLPDKDGAVVLQSMICRGCETRNCIMACPYSAFLETATGTMVLKCDLCAHRRAVGLGPACADMCPTGAIFFVPRSELPRLMTPEALAAEKKLLEHIRPSFKGSR